MKYRIWDKAEKWYNKSLIITQQGKVYSVMFNQLVEVEQNYIIEQYTGINDVDGNEIYEGDIVDTKSKHGIVNIDDLHLFFYWFMEGVYQDDKIKIIGNIHDN